MNNSIIGGKLKTVTGCLDVDSCQLPSDWSSRVLLLGRPERDGVPGDVSVAFVIPNEHSVQKIVVLPCRKY